MSPRIIDTYRQRFGEHDGAESDSAESGPTGSWWKVFALDEDLFELMLDRHGWQFSDQRQLPAALREIALARTGWVSESVFVFSQHCKLLRRLDVSETKIAAIPSWTTQSCWTDAERAVLAYTDGLVAARGRVDDATFDMLRLYLSEVAILELTFMVSTYISSATICRALRLELDDREDPVIAACPKHETTTQNRLE